jgi:hypothetical protein
MRWMGHVAFMRRWKMFSKKIVEKPEGKSLGDVGADDRIILKCIFKKQGVRYGLNSFRSR